MVSPSLLKDYVEMDEPHCWGYLHRFFAIYSPSKTVAITVSDSYNSHRFQRGQYSYCSQIWTRADFACELSMDHQFADRREFSHPHPHPHTLQPPHPPTPFEWSWHEWIEEVYRRFESITSKKGFAAFVKDLIEIIFLCGYSTNSHSNWFLVSYFPADNLRFTTCRQSQSISPFFWLYFMWIIVELLKFSFHNIHLEKHSPLLNQMKPTIRMFDERKQTAYRVCTLVCLIQQQTSW